MELDLTPKKAEALFEGDGGGYYTWSMPLLAEKKLGAGRLVLQPRGFAFPHYADSSKVGYVIQGQCPYLCYFPLMLLHRIHCYCYCIFMDMCRD